MLLQLRTSELVSEVVKLQKEFGLKVQLNRWIQN